MQWKKETASGTQNRPARRAGLRFNRLEENALLFPGLIPERSPANITLPVGVNDQPLGAWPVTGLCRISNRGWLWLQHAQRWAFSKGARTGSVRLVARGTTGRTGTPARGALAVTKECSGRKARLCPVVAR